MVSFTEGEAYGAVYGQRVLDTLRENAARLTVRSGQYSFVLYYILPKRTVFSMLTRLQLIIWCDIYSCITVIVSMLPCASLSIL
jgi:hypothetical protein